MPKIPSYESSVGIKPVNMPDASLAPIQASKQAQGGVVNAIENIENVITEVDKYRQKNEASAFTFERLNDITSRADQDIELDSTPYETEIDKLGADAAKTIRSQVGKDEFMASFSRQATAAKWGIKNDFRAKKLEAAQAVTEYKRQQIVNSYAGMDDARKMESVAEFKNMLVEGVNTGIYTKGEADKINLKFQEDTQQAVVDNDIIVDPDTALTGLEQGEDGPYPGISDQFRNKSKVKAKAYSKKYKVEAEIEQKNIIDANETDIVTRLLDPAKPNPSEGEIIEMMNSGDPTKQIRPEFADAVIKNLRTAKKKTLKPLDADFADIISYINEGRMTPEKIRDQIIGKVSDGYLSEDDAVYASTYLNEMTDKSADKLVIKLKKSSWFGLHKFSEENVKGRKDSRARMSRTYLSKMRSGIDPQLAAQEAIKEEVLYLIPEARNHPEGLEVFDSEGNRKLVMPNGDLVESAGSKYMKSQEKK